MLPQELLRQLGEEERKFEGELKRERTARASEVCTIAAFGTEFEDLKLLV